MIRAILVNIGWPNRLLFWCLVILEVAIVASVIILAVK